MGWVELSGLRILKPAAQPKSLRVENFQTKPTRQPKPNQPKPACWIGFCRLVGWPVPLNTPTLDVHFSLSISPIMHYRGSMSQVIKPFIFKILIILIKVVIKPKLKVNKFFA